MDDLDYAQERIDVELEREIQAQRARLSVDRASAEECVECGAEIAHARREAVPGVELCIGCAEIAEEAGRHRR